MVFKKCPKGYDRHGCCTCAIRCPAPYIENEFHCHKPPFKILKTYESINQCNNDSQINCVRFGTRFVVGDCGENYERVGASMCVPKCPLGWKDEGKRCFKPGTFHNGPPFTWAYGDEDDPHRELEISDQNIVSENDLDSENDTQDEQEYESRNLNENSGNNLQSDSNNPQLYESNNTPRYNTHSEENSNRNQNFMNNNFSSDNGSPNRDSRNLNEQNARDQNSSDTSNSYLTEVFDDNKNKEKAEKNNRNIFSTYVPDDFDQD